jgi:phage gpG-like protein
MNEVKLETKEELISSIKEWIKIDNEILKHTKEIKDMKKKQKLLTNSLVNVMKNNQLECFDINGGKILYKKSKCKKPINTKTLLNTLKTYYNDTPNKAEEITEYILKNREEVIKETIRRKLDKKNNI